MNESKLQYKRFEKRKNPKITISLKTFLELLIQTSNIPVRIREPTKEEIEFHRKHGQPPPVFAMERIKQPVKKIGYID